MITRKRFFPIVALAGVAAVVGWYLFRPERLFIDREVSEAPPAAAASAAILVSGDFHSNAHQTGGRATIYQLADGRRVLRLSGFSTSNGPDVRVYLVAAADVNDNDAADRDGFVDLGSLKGNVGDQNYILPVDVDLRRYRAVSIWCRRFSVNFGAAPLG